MPLKGQQGVIAVHAAAIVADADQLPPAGFDLDPNAGGPRVERIFEQFLHHRGGPVHHLARGDLVRHLVRKNSNAPHKKSG